MIEALEEEKDESKRRKPLSLSTPMPISQEMWMV